MPKYIPYNYNQNTLIAINFDDQIQAGTFEYALHYLVDNKLDLSIFDSGYNNDENGRPAYNPAILLKIILFAYSKGITSSREIDWCCRYNIIFKALSCDTVPHFTTIAHFISHAPEKIESLFEQVLLVCDEQGLLGNELFAIDGCKLPSNAAKEWSGTFDELKAKRDKLKRLIRHHLAEHEKQDQREEFESVQKARTEQTIETLNKAHDKIDQFLKTSHPRMGGGKRPKEIKSNITDNQSAKMKTSKGTIQGYNGIACVDKKHQVIIDCQAFGSGQEQQLLKPVLEKVNERYDRLNFNQAIYETDVLVTADTGFANEANMKYLHASKINGYVPDNQFRSRDPKFQDQKSKYGQRHQSNKKKSAKQLMPASEFNFDPINKTCQCPAGYRMRLRCEKRDKAANDKIFFEGSVPKCRHCELKHNCMKNPAISEKGRGGHGRQVSFILKKHPGSKYTEWMRHRVDSQLGKQVYSHRMSVVEPVFGNITTNKGLHRFSLRGKDKVQGQWQLFCMIHNIEKIANYGTIQ